MCYARPKQLLQCSLDDPVLLRGDVDVADKPLGGYQDIIELVITGSEYCYLLLSKSTEKAACFLLLSFSSCCLLLNRIVQ